MPINCEPSPQGTLIYTEILCVQKGNRLFAGVYLRPENPIYFLEFIDLQVNLVGVLQQCDLLLCCYYFQNLKLELFHPVTTEW